MARKGFTLIEVLVVIIIVGILATIAIPSYQGFLEDSKARVCQANLVSLKAAMDVYVMEQGVVPADLSRIPDACLRRALARQKQEGGWRLRLAFAVDELNNLGIACAEIVEELARGNLKLLRCPSDKNGGVSYGVCAYLIDVPASVYKDMVAADLPIPFIADSTVGRFVSIRELSYRHRRIAALQTKVDYAFVILNDGMILAVDSTGANQAVYFKGLTLRKDGGTAADSGNPAYVKMRKRLGQSVYAGLAKMLQLRSQSSGPSSYDPYAGLPPAAQPPASSSALTASTASAAASAPDPAVSSAAVSSGTDKTGIKEGHSLDFGKQPDNPDGG